LEYTSNDIKEILKELHITPLKTNKVDSAQAATILTWRLKREYGIDRPYTTTAVRRRVDTGKLPVAEQLHRRFNLYNVRHVFDLSLMPGRSEGAKYRTTQRVSKHKENSPISDHNGIDIDTII
jgi:hypothetical protein